MDTINSEMTGEPNPQNRPSVFAFDPYMQQNAASGNWMKISNPQPPYQGVQFPNLQPQRVIQTPPQTFLGSFNPPSASSVATNYGSPPGIPGSFSFGSPESKPTSYPVQFPFPSNVTSMDQNSPVHAMAGPGMINQPSLPEGQAPVSPMSRVLGANRHGTFGRHAYSFGNHPQASTSSESDIDFYIPMRGKRKCKEPPLQPAKQHITEEIMAQHMSNLHINSETAVPDETESRREKRLYMCAEMRKLQNESIIPESLLSRVNRPCTALVLWTPPPRIFPALAAMPDENQNTSVGDENEQNKMDNEPVDIEIDSSIATNEMDFDL